MKADLIVVGAGVLGTFHAYHALRQGRSIVLLEKDAMPAGATVRNFGEIVPSGLGPGRWQNLGIESMNLYKGIQSELYFSSDIEVGKIQMMQTVPQPGLRLPGSILTGLTIRRYESFHGCPSYLRLDNSVVNPLLRQFGIHVLVKQAADGSLIIGDAILKLVEAVTLPCVSFT